MKQLSGGISFLRNLGRLPVMAAAAKGPEASQRIADALEEIRDRLERLERELSDG